MPFKNGIQFLFSHFHENIGTAEGVEMHSVEMGLRGGQIGTNSNSQSYIPCSFMAHNSFLLLILS
jgi:hypothetical protein